MNAFAELGAFPAREDRISWAGERMWDFAEGKISCSALAVLEQLLLGWADLATEEERRQYRGLSRQVRALLHATD
jgi:hypothetical protein